MTIIFLTAALCASAEESQVLTFDRYMENVKNCNIGYLAEKYNIDIAEANEKAAKVFPDPELSVEYANNQNWNLQMGYSVDIAVEYTLELGGKRGARRAVARSEKELTAALVEDYFRNLRADATIAYLDVLRQKRITEIQRSSYEQMLALAHADSIRFSLGAITEVDARRSRLEAATMLCDVYSSECDYRDALVQLLMFQGDSGNILPDSVEGTLYFVKQEFNPADLIFIARNNRADFQAAIKSKELSQNNMRLAKANRAIDLGLSIGGSYSSTVRNEIAPAPSFKGITAGISIPLKFSNTNKGELSAARLAICKSELEYADIEQKIGSEVIQAHNRYVAGSLRAEQFESGMLEEARFILEKVIYSYERGETDILQVLNAQRTYNDIQIAYNETLHECAVAMVELQRSCGGTDIQSPILSYSSSVTGSSHSVETPSPGMENAR